MMIKTNEDRIDELHAEWDRLNEAGTPVSPAELCRDCPELLPEFEQLIAGLEALDAFMSGESLDFQKEAPAPSANFVAGRYRPFRFHKRGGLGEVFVAKDSELRRDVAVKRIRKRSARNPDSRARFLVEAEITSKLEHPGIVPIYGLGLDDSGHPYYAMRFIDGETFGEAIDRFHDADQPGRDPGERRRSFQKLLRSFLAVCQTIGYAHSHKIVHRDLKPGNIMLGRYDETLVVDWGLAKALGDPNSKAPADEHVGPFIVRGPAANGSGGIRETAAGSVKGSPAFMSPEQAAGKWDQVGTASDTYSLGATFYVLLTGAAPFEGKDVSKVIEQVKKGDFLPPREVNHRVPGALEAICLKAMQKEPAARYASAPELAADIEHWLADEPVGAWSEPWSHRIVRSIRKHRTIASTIVAAAIVALVGLGVLVWQQRTANRELAQKNAELKISNQRAADAAEEANANANRARQQEREATFARRRAERELYFNTIALAYREFLGGNLERSYAALRESPAGLRGWEWNYINRLHHCALLSVRLPGETCVAVTVSPDGRLIAAASDRNVIRLIDAQTGQTRLVVSTGEGQLPQHRSAVGMAFSPDGTRFAFGGPMGVVDVWDLSLPQPALKWHSLLFEDEVCSLVFSNDGKQIFAADLSDNLKDWKYETQEEAASLPFLGGLGGRNLYRYWGGNSPGSVALSGDGTIGVASVSNDIVVWDPKTRVELKKMRQERSLQYSGTISRDGSLFAVGGQDGIVRLWNARQLDQPPRLLYGHKGAVNSLAFSPDGTRLASGGEDRTVRVWSVAGESPLEILTLRAHMGAVRSVAYAPDGKRIVSAGTTRIGPQGELEQRSAEVKVWDADRAQLESSVGAGHVAAFSPDGRSLLIGGLDGVRVTDPLGAAPEARVAGIEKSVLELAFNHGGTQFAANSDGKLHLFLWNGVQANLVRSIDPAVDTLGKSFSFFYPAYSPDDSLLAVTASNRVAIYDLTGIGAPVTWDPGFYPKKLFFSPDGRQVGACGGAGIEPGQFALFDLASKKEVKRLPGWTDCALSRSGGLVALAGGDKSAVSQLQMRSFAEDRELYTLNFYMSYLMGLGFTPDGQRLAIWGGEPHAQEPAQVRLLDAESGHEALLLAGNAKQVTAVAISPDGGLIAYCQDGAVRIWDGRPLAAQPAAAP